MAEVTIESLTSWRGELIESRAAGVRRLVHQNGQTIEYKSDSEMARAIASLDAEIERMTRPAIGRLRFSTSKGL